MKLAQEADRTIGEISEMGKKTLFGKIEATPDEWKTVTNLAKEAVTGRATIRTLRDKLKRSDDELKQANGRLKSHNHGISETMEYFQAKARSPTEINFYKLPRTAIERSISRRQANIILDKGRLSFVLALKSFRVLRAILRMLLRFC